MTGRELKYAVVSSGLTVMGGGLWIWSWCLPPYENKISMKMSLMGPMFAVLGIGFLPMPFDLESPYVQACELAHERGERVPFRYAPRKYKVLTVVAVASGFINLLCIRFSFL